jgi:hypothetical protein
MSEPTIRGKCEIVGRAFLIGAYGLLLWSALLRPPGDALSSALQSVSGILMIVGSAVPALCWRGERS